MQSLDADKTNRTAIGDLPQHFERDGGTFLVAMKGHEGSPAVGGNFDEVSAVGCGRNGSAVIQALPFENAIKIYCESLRIQAPR